MPRDPTIRTSGTVGAIAAVGWLLSGVLRALLAGSSFGSGSLAELLVPGTGGALLGAGAPLSVLAGLAGALAVGAVTGLLTYAVVRRPPGRAGVLLACWFAAVLGSGLGQLVSAAIAPGSAWLTVGNDVQSALWAGPYWGVVYGWAVGQAAVALLGRSGVTLVPAAAARARSAALVAGVVVGLGWVVTGLLQRGIVDALGSGSPAARIVPVLLPNTATDYLDGGMPQVTVAFGLAALVVGSVAGVVTWVAARSADPAAGRTAFVLAAWLGAVLGGSLGPALTALGYAARVGEGGLSPALVLNVLAAGVPTSALWGVLYGWLGVVAALVVLGRARRRARPVGTQARQPAHRA
ncbi:hypothetical protein HP550_03755 [Cellulomonas humilata]|uniref:Uncharacterized protein n=1 Tax=Cellulomonas humilata TaxID=144055 RepID=A0A7Y5ZY96_9CELL|nr:hypothetical protein [Cellulomonas humilata]NUU16361.1 hypothetical protein [Cellulomonas humilata]